MTPEELRYLADGVDDTKLARVLRSNADTIERLQRWIEQSDSAVLVISEKLVSELNARTTAGRRKPRETWMNAELRDNLEELYGLLRDSDAEIERLRRENAKAERLLKRAAWFIQAQEHADWYLYSDIDVFLRRKKSTAAAPQEGR